MRSVIYLCASLGTIVGGYVPTAWGASDFSLQSVAFAAVGGIAGLWVGMRLSAD